MPLLIALIVRNSHIFTEIFIFLKIVFEIYPDVYQYITQSCFVSFVIKGKFAQPSKSLKIL